MLPPFNVSFYRDFFPNVGLQDPYVMVQFASLRLDLYEILKKNENVTASELYGLLGDSPLRHLLTDEEDEISQARRILEELMFVEDDDAVTEARKIDLLGHHLLKIMYCNHKSQFYQEFFRKMEVSWFKLRWSIMNECKKKGFLEENHLTVPVATVEEKISAKIQDDEVWHRVYFTQVIELVPLRKYPLHNGYQFFPNKELVFWLEQVFNESLTKCIKHTMGMMSSLDENLQGFTKCLKLVRPFHYEIRGDLTQKNLESKLKFFPLCMKNQYECFRKKHHLKHDSRMQLDLFMKDCGFPLEDTLEMWREELLKVKEEKDLRSYMYFIKHLYGVVGSKLLYKGLSCDQIISHPVRPQGVSGCPFKEWSDEKLEERLKEEGVQQEVILKLKSEEKYKEACGNYFGCLFTNRLESVGHPNEYFQAASGCLRDIEDLV